MINRSTRDLESATVRTRFFGGRTVDSIATEMPILPVTAPGIPQPGPSFIRFAQTMGDPPPEAQPVVKGRKKPVPERPDGAYLNALVRTVLYQSGSAVTLVDESSPTVFMPGLHMVGDVMRDQYGPTPCRFMVIGKCPGRQEVSCGRPFVGDFNRPLWEAWDEAGIPRPSHQDPVYITNLIRFLPPKGLSRYPKAWIEDGTHLLYQEIAVVRPQVILILGADALKALFGPKAKLSDYRGRTVEFAVDCRPMPDAPPDIHRTKIVVAEHPASVAHDSSNYPAMLAGLKEAAVLLGHRKPAAPAVRLDHQPVYTLAELRVAVKESIAASAAGGYIAFDCEWEGRPPWDENSYVYTIQWSHAPGHARTVFLRRCGGLPNAALPLEEATPLLKKLFEEAPVRGARLVGHFAKADLPALLSLGVDLYDHYVGVDDDPSDMPSALSREAKSYFEGAFDTYIAAHAVAEDSDLKLEILGATLVEVPRYDTEMLEWKAAYCRQHTISQRKLRGYGNAPEEKIGPYGMWDADTTGRLYLKLNGDPRENTSGMLDKDRFGQSSRKIFATRMRAWGAWAEMERYGLEVDKFQQKRLREILAAKKTEILDVLRAEARWDLPDNKLDLAKTRHRVEFMFGTEWITWERQAPPGALCLNLKPYKTTDTSYGGRLWDEAVAMYENDDTDGPPRPSSDQETVIHKSREHPLVGMIRDIDFISTAMKILFRLPDEKDEDDSDEDEEKHDRGLMALICDDGRVRSIFGFVETGRSSSSKPNLQNCSSGRDEQFDRILELKDEKFVSRSVFKARDGWFLVSADLKGAEILASAVNSGDQVLMEHAIRSNLDESDPNYLDLHSDLANRAFRLGMTAKQIKKERKSLRVAAKKTRFGHNYGASAETMLRQVLEESPDITLAQVEAIRQGLMQTYPVQEAYFASSRVRATSVGWMCNGYGGRRRFRRVTARDKIAGQEREAQNWTAQGLVADGMNVALGNIWYELRKRKMRTRILLSVHDSVVLECPADEVEMVVDVILPSCMTTVAIVPTDFNGTPNGRPPAYFGIDVEVFRNWGVAVEESEWRKGVAA